MKAPAQLLLGRRITEVAESEIFFGASIPVAELIGDQSYVEVPALGVSMVLSDHEHISAVQLHNEGHDGYRKFSGVLPGSIQFWMSRADVRGLLGSPVQSGEGGTVLILGYRPAWDSFTSEGQRLHLEYDDDNESIRLVTISSDGA